MARIAKIFGFWDSKLLEIASELSKDASKCTSLAEVAKDARIFTNVHLEALSDNSEAISSNFESQNPIGTLRHSYLFCANFDTDSYLVQVLFQKTPRKRGKK